MSEEPRRRRQRYSEKVAEESESPKSEKSDAGESSNSSENKPVTKLPRVRKDEPEKNEKSPPVHKRKKGLCCKQCGSGNVTVQFVQTGAETRHRKNGCLWKIGRLTLIVFTFGLWLLVGKRSGKSGTTFHNDKVAVCHNCGHSWKIKKHWTLAQKIVVAGFACFWIVVASIGGSNKETTVVNANTTSTMIPTVSTAIPAQAHTVIPTVAPSAVPTSEPTAEPTFQPTTEPTDIPTAEPAIEPEIPEYLLGDNSEYARDGVKGLAYRVAVDPQLSENELMAIYRKLIEGDGYGNHTVFFYSSEEALNAGMEYDVAQIQNEELTLATEQAKRNMQLVLSR